MTIPVRIPARNRVRSDGMNASDGILRHCVPQNDIQPVILNEVKNPERIDRDSMHRKGA